MQVHPEGCMCESCKAFRNKKLQTKFKENVKDFTEGITFMYKERDARELIKKISDLTSEYYETHKDLEED